MKLTENHLRTIIRTVLLESSTRTIDLAKLLKKNRITMPGQIGRSMVDLAILGSEGFEIVSHLPFSGKYRKGVDTSSPSIYQSIARAVRADELQSQVDSNKVCTFELNGSQYRFTFGLRPKSPDQQCREEAEALRNIYKVPENDLMSELEDKGWTKRQIKKALK